MPKRIFAIAMAFLGLSVGAGFASGQEMNQYFVSFGIPGIWAVVFSAIIMALSGLAVMALGSYYQADEHTAVFDQIASPWVSRLLDVTVTLTVFCTGTVMIAGAGANLNQQFGLPVWVGSVILIVMVLLAGLLDVNKVSNVISLISPLIVVVMMVASIYAIVHAQNSLTELEPLATQIHSTLPHWTIASLNYVGLCIMIAVSMSIVIGGTYLNPREAGIGGLLGGTIYGVMLLVATLALYFSVADVAHEDMPMLAIVDQIHPVFGVITALVIYGMIFNSAIGMFYALGRRVTRRRPQNFRFALFGAVGLGFLLSFLGFRTLVGYAFPVLGYVGIILIAVLIGNYFFGRSTIVEETERRSRIRKLTRRKLHPNRVFNKADQDRLDRAVAASNVDNIELRTTVRDEILTELIDDVNVDFDESDAERILAEPITELVSPEVKVVDPNPDESLKHPPKK